MSGQFIPKGAPCVVLGNAIEHPFIVGDIVTRDGTDEQEVIDVNWAGDLIDVRCIKAPAAWEDGVTWCKVGDVESNLARRYELVRSAVDGARRVIASGGSVTLEERLRALPYGFKNAHGIEYRYILEWVPLGHRRAADGYKTGIWSAGYYAVGSAWTVDDHATLDEAVTHLEAAAARLDPSTLQNTGNKTDS